MPGMRPGDSTPLDGDPALVLRGLLDAAARRDAITINGVDYFPLNHGERLFLAAIIRDAVTNVMERTCDPDLLHMASHAADLGYNLSLFDQSAEAARGAPPA